MITENRWQHILGVARKAKILAGKLKPDSAQYAEDMFLLGVMHDLGYEVTLPMRRSAEKYSNAPVINIGRK